MDDKEIRSMLSDPATRSHALSLIGNWVKDTCLLFGAEPGTAHLIPFLLVEGIAASWEKRNPDFRIMR